MFALSIYPLVTVGCASEIQQLNNWLLHNTQANFVLHFLTNKLFLRRDGTLHNETIDLFCLRVSGPNNNHFGDRPRAYPSFLSVQYPTAYKSIFRFEETTALVQSFISNVWTVSSPSTLEAEHCKFEASEPTSGSVRANAPWISKRANFGRKRCFCSSLPFYFNDKQTTM